MMPDLPKQCPVCKESFDEEKPFMDHISNHFSKAVLRVGEAGEGARRSTLGETANPRGVDWRGPTRIPLPKPRVPPLAIKDLSQPLCISCGKQIVIPKMWPKDIPVLNRCSECMIMASQQEE